MRLRFSTNFCFVGVLLVSLLLLFFHEIFVERGGASSFTPQILVCKALSLSVSHGNDISQKIYLPPLLILVRFVPIFVCSFFYRLCIMLCILFVANNRSSRGDRVGCYRMPYRTHIDLSTYIKKYHPRHHPSIHRNHHPSHHHQVIIMESG